MGKKGEVLTSTLKISQRASISILLLANIIGKCALNLAPADLLFIVTPYITVSKRPAAFVHAN